MLTMKKILLTFILIIISTWAFCDCLVVCEGVAQIHNNDIAKARDEAITDAKNNAVEKSVGLFLSRDMVASNQQVISDLILTKSSAFVSNVSVIEGTEEKFILENTPMLKLQIQAHIKLASIWTDIQNIEALYSAVGKPRFMVVSDNEKVKNNVSNK